MQTIDFQFELCYNTRSSSATNPQPCRQFHATEKQIIIQNKKPLKFDSCFKGFFDAFSNYLPVLNTRKASFIARTAAWSEGKRRGAMVAKFSADKKMVLLSAIFLSTNP